MESLEIKEKNNDLSETEKEDRLSSENSIEYETGMEIEGYNGRENRSSDFDVEGRGIDITAVKNKVLIGIAILMVVFALSVLIFHKDPNAGGDKTKSHKREEGQFEKIDDGKGNTYNILRTYSRENGQYTQGLYFTKNGELLESTGIEGESKIQYYTIDEKENRLTRKKIVEINKGYFGEGCDEVSHGGKDYVFQLTWQNRKVIRYSQNLEKEAELEIPSEMREGWGMTHDPKNPGVLVASDSTQTLFFIDWVSDLSKLVVTSKKPITRGDALMYYINEMEWAGDYIVANVYLTKEINIIDTNTNKVIRTIDMSLLLERANQEQKKRGKSTLTYLECLNGIAYDHENKVFYVTGKYWPLVFKIEFPESYLKRTN